VVVSGRPMTAAATGIATAGVLFGSGYGTIGHSLLRMTSLMVVVMVAFLANDLWDEKADRAAGRRRPLAMRQVERRTLVIGGTSLGLLAVLIETALGSPDEWLFLVGLGIAGVAYSPLAWRLPKIKNIWMAFVVSGAMLYAASITGTRLSPTGIVSLGIFILGREVLLDVRDLESDLSQGRVSLAGVLGRKMALAVAMLLVGGGVVGYGIVVHNMLFWAAVGSGSILFYILHVQRGFEVAFRESTHVLLLLGALGTGALVR